MLHGLKAAMQRAGAEDDGKVVTLQPASLDNLLDQVKQAESRKAAGDARHAAEKASMLWQHGSEEKALEARHAQEGEALSAEIARTQEMFVKALAARAPGIDLATLNLQLEPAGEGEAR